MKIIITLFITLILNQLVQASLIQSKMTFIAKGKPAFIKIEGSSQLKSAKLTLKKNTLKGTFLLDLSTITTGAQLRDEHLKNKYLEVEKKEFQHAVITFSSPYDSNKTSHSITALLKLHGVEKKVQLKANILKNNNIMNIKVNFPINIKHYNINVPSFKGITVAKTVNITVEAKVDIK